MDNGTDPGNNIERVARVLFTDFLWPFQITAALLVVAVIGAIVLARRSGQAPEADAQADSGASTEASDRAVGTLRRSEPEPERLGPRGQEREG